MSVVKTDEEFRYCTSCGSANKKSAVLCCECNKKVIEKHRPISSFLLKRFKSDVLEKGKSHIYDFLKDFLYKHLYGMVLSVSIVTTGAVVLANPTPYIEKVNTFPTAPIPSQQEEHEESRQPFEFTENDRDTMWYLISNYDTVVDNTLRPVNTYWEDLSEPLTIGQFFAEGNIDGYSYQGRHDLSSNPIPFSMGESEEFYGEPGEEPYGQRDWVEQTMVFGADVTSSLGQTLYAEGYDVYEIDYYLMTFKGSFPYDFEALPPTDKEYLEKLVYRFLIVRKPDVSDWYIAEERLIERFGV